MAELRTMAADVSKNAADVENYSKEFLELQDQLKQMKREKFNGVELFAVEAEEDDLQGVNKAHLRVNGELHDNVNGKRATGSYANQEEYEYFDDPLVANRTISTFDKYEFELYTHPTGVAEDGNIKLNIVNLQSMLGLKDPGDQFGVDQTQTDLNPITDSQDGLITGAEWTASGFDDGSGAGTLDDGNIHADEISAFETANPGWEIQTETDLGVDLDGNGFINNAAGRMTAAPDLYDNNNKSLKVENTLNLAGLNQAALDPGDKSVHLSNDGTNYADFLTSEGYIKDITKISIEEFTNIIEKIADVRAENGAEQQRVNQSLNLHQNNLVNLEAAHGRIMDVDVALESTRLARHSVKVQASAAMVAQANQMTSVALTLLQ
jgi:flagellin-like hook-associated protein FlgL